MRTIGEKVWVPVSTHERIIEKCPDCLGERKWLAILPSGEQYHFECPRCYPGGFDHSTGFIRERWNFSVSAKQATITGLRFDHNEESYSTSEGYFPAEDVFDTEANAVARAQVKAEEYQKREYAQMAASARRKKGKPEPFADGTIDPNHPSFGHTIVYAQSQVRRGLEEALRWMEFAASKHTKIDIRKMIDASGLLNEKATP